jgi:hypothetical protein
MAAEICAEIFYTRRGSYTKAKVVLWTLPIAYKILDNAGL